jgi:hypothetical protein
MRSFPVHRRIGLTAMRRGARPLLAALPALARIPGTDLLVRLGSESALRAFFEAIGPSLAADIADKLMVSDDRRRAPDQPARTP